MFAVGEIGASTNFSYLCLRSQQISNRRQQSLAKHVFPSGFANIAGRKWPKSRKRIIAEVLTRQIGLVGKQTLWGRIKSRVQNACKWRRSSLCVCTADFHYLCPRIKFIFICVCLWLFTAAQSWSVEKGGVSLLLANRFICHIDVCLQCNLLLVYRAAYIYSPSGPNARDREEHLLRRPPRRSLEIAL